MAGKGEEREEKNHADGNENRSSHDPLSGFTIQKSDRALRFCIVCVLDGGVFSFAMLVVWLCNWLAGKLGVTPTKDPIIFWLKDCLAGVFLAYVLLVVAVDFIDEFKRHCRHLPLWKRK